MGVGPLLVALAAAQAQVPAAAEPAAPAAIVETQGVIPYPANFFASAEPNTAMDMIQRLPGFVFDGGSDQVRGFGGAGGNVLIDGERPTSKSDNLDSVVRRVPASQVERIDLIRGAPGIDMQGKTVIANIVRKQGAAVTGLASYAHIFNADDGRHAPQMRLEGTRRNGATLMEGSLVVAGFFDDGWGDGPLVRVPAVGATQRLDIYTEGDGTQGVGTGAFETPMLGGKLRANGQIFVDNYNFDFVEYSPGGLEGAVIRDGSRRRHGEFGLNFNRPLGEASTLELVGLQQVRKRDFTQGLREGADTALFTNERLTSESIVRSVVRTTRSDTLSFEFGGEGAYNRLDSETGYSANGARIVLPAANVIVEELRGELFATGTWKPVSVLTVEAGLRSEGSKISSEGDVVLEKTLQFVKPRGVLTWSPNTDNQVRLRIEREVGQLNFGDFVATSSLDTGVVRAGNPDLNPPQEWLAEATYERRFMGRGAVVLTYRHSKVTDVVDRAPVFSATDVFDSPANIGDATKGRIDASVTLPLDGLGIAGGLLRGKYTRRWSEVEDPTTGLLRPISAERETEWEVHFTQDLPRWRGSWGIDLFGGWTERYYRFDEIETVKLRPFLVPFAEFKARPDLAVRFEIRNAGERGFERIRESFPGSRATTAREFVETRDLQFGRMFYVRLRKTFG